MTVFPMFEIIDQKQFLIIGGGKVAKRKVEHLLAFTSLITVIAPDTEIEGVRVLRREYQESDLSTADYVVAATSDPDVNRSIYEACSKRRIPVNVVDDPSLCTFLFPAVIRRGDLTIGLSTGGTSPAYSARLRAEIEAMLPDRIEEILLRMGMIRNQDLQIAGGQKERAACYREVLALLLATDGAAGDEDINDIIRKYQSH